MSNPLIDCILVMGIYILGMRTVKNLNESGNPNCEFVFKDIKILDRCHYEYDEQLRFIESVLLKQSPPNLNTQERSVELNIVF